MKQSQLKNYEIHIKRIPQVWNTTQQKQYFNVDNIEKDKSHINHGKIIQKQNVRRKNIMKRSR